VKEETFDQGNQQLQKLPKTGYNAGNIVTEISTQPKDLKLRL